MSDLDTEEAREEAGRPARRDLTTGSLGAAVVAMSLPMVLDQVVTALTRLVELYFLGRLGPEVLAASSLGAMVSFVIVSAGMGIGVAALATVARRVGEGDAAAAGRVVWQALALSAVFGVVFGAVGAATSRPLLVVLGASGAVLDEGTLYLQVSFALTFLLILNLTANRALRGAGEARAALWTMALGSAVSVVTAPALILGFGPVPSLGVAGAALSAGLGHATGWGAAMAVLLRGRLTLRLRLRDARFDRGVFLALLRLGAPVTGQLLLRSTSRLALAPIIASFGAPALAAYGIVIRLMMFPLSLGFGLGAAAGTLVGQSLGAGLPRRAAASAWLIAATNVALNAAIVAGYVLWARPLVATLVEGGPEVVDDGVHALRVLAPAYVFSALGVVMGRSLEGAGDTMPAMWVNLLTLWLVQLPLAWALSTVPSLGATGVWLGIGAANVANALVLAAWFHRGGWTNKRI